MAVGMAYRRLQREKHIKRKEHILKKYRADNMPSDFNSSDLWAVENEKYPRISGHTHRAAAVALEIETSGLCNPYWYVKARGQLSKGKIHCSCPMCSAKTKNKGRHTSRWAPVHNYKISDLRKLENMDNQFKDWEKG